MAKSAKVTKKDASDAKARGKGADPKKPVTKNNVKGLMKPGKGK